MTKDLQSGSGVWNVHRIVYKNIETHPSGQLTVEATVYDAGSFTFQDGQGNYTYSDFGVTRAGTFVYSVDGEEIDIVYDLQNSGGYQNTGSYVGTPEGNLGYTLIGTETYEDSSSKTVFTGEFTLRR